MEPALSSVPSHPPPSLCHNGRKEFDFFIVMTFDAEIDKTHHVCLWLMDAFKDSHEKLGFWPQWRDHTNPKPGVEPPLEPMMIAAIHPKLKNRVAFCLHLSGNDRRITSRSSDGKLKTYDHYQSGFVDVTDAGVRTECLMEAIQEYTKKQAPPAYIHSCTISGIPEDRMKDIWWAMIGERNGYMVYPMYGIIPNDTVREMSFNFGWKDYPPNEDIGFGVYASFQEISDDE